MPVPHDQLPRMEPISTRVNVYTTTKPAHRERPSSPLVENPRADATCELPARQIARRPKSIRAVTPPAKAEKPWHLNGQAGRGADSASRSRYGTFRPLWACLPDH